MTSLPSLYNPNEMGASRPTRPFLEPSLAKLRNALGEVNGNPVLMTGVEISPASRRQLQALQTNLKSRLSCGANDARDKAVEIAKLTAGFPMQGMDDVPMELRAGMFFDALDDLPAWAVRETRMNIVAGMTKFGRPFGPGPIEFADLVRVTLKPFRDDQRDLDTLLLAKPITVEPTPAERQRVVDGFAKLKADIAPKSSVAA